LIEGVLRIVLTDGPKRAFIPGLRVLAALYPGRPLLGIRDFGQAGVVRMVEL
jgi:hypothetical protein